MSRKSFTLTLTGAVFVALAVQIGAFAVAGSSPIVFTGAALLSGAAAVVCFRPVLKVRDDTVIIRNIRTREVPLENVRGVLPRSDGFHSTSWVDLVGEPTIPTWALTERGLFGRIGPDRMSKRADEVTAAIARAKSHRRSQPTPHD